MKEKIKLKILNKKIGNSIPLPKYITEGSSGMDLRVCTDCPLYIQPKEVQLLSTGIAIHIYKRNITAMIIPRSGLGHNGIILGNSVGLIDSDYQGEIKISCWNRSDIEFIINPGDRIAQLVFVPIVKVNFEIVNYFNNSTRGIQGFGSTGQK